MKKIKSRKVKKKRKENFKVLLFILVGGIVFYCSSFVSAGEYDSILEKNRIDNVYAVTNIGGRDRIFYLNMYELNGRISYCIEIGVDITTDVYHSTDIFLSGNLSNEQIDYIRGISYFGYGYKNHNDYKYYMASQELIWEYLSDVEVEWTNEMKIDGNRIIVDEYKLEILELKEMYDEKLGLEVGQVYKVGDEIVLENGMLSNYEVVSSKYSDVSIVNGSLIIKVGNVIGVEEIKLKKKEDYGYNSLLYYYDNSQRLISNGNYKEVDTVLNFKIEGLSVSTKMINNVMPAERPLGEGTFFNALYGLYDENDNLLGTYKSDSNGRFTVESLIKGNYYFKQIEPSEGYLLNEDKTNFKVDKDGMNISLIQKPISNYIEIKKVYGSDGNYWPEAGILFYVYNSKGANLITAFTGSTGDIGFILYYGSYRVHQGSTKYGYAKVDDFTIDVREHNEKKVQYNLVNELIRVKIRVNTIDEVSRELLRKEGIAYKVRKSEENTYLEYDGNDIFKTDNEGNLIIPILLEYGDYVLEQVEVPKGIISNDKEIEFSIDDNSNLKLEDNNLIMDIEVSNKLVTGEVKVVTFLEEFYKELNNYGYKQKIRVGNEITLISNEDIITNGNIKYKKGEVINDGITNEEGELMLDNLYLGSYCLIDKDTNEEKCFKLVPNGEEEIVRENVEFNKILIKKDIIINNLSSDGELLVGNIFELVDGEGLIINTGITNDEGIIRIEDIALGNYCVRQKKVKNGYRRLDNEICFLLEDDKILDIVNGREVNEVINIPDTLKNDIGFYESFVILIMIGTVYIVYKKIFNSKLYR